MKLWEKHLAELLQDGGLESFWCKAMRLKYADSPDFINTLVMTRPKKPSPKFMKGESRPNGSPVEGATVWVRNMCKKHKAPALFRIAWYFYLVDSVHGMRANRTNYLVAACELSRLPWFIPHANKLKEEYDVQRKLMREERTEQDRFKASQFAELATTGLFGELKAYKTVHGWSEEDYAKHYPARYQRLLAKREVKALKKKGKKK